MSCRNLRGDEKIIQSTEDITWYYHWWSETELGPVNELLLLSEWCLYYWRFQISKLYLHQFKYLSFQVHYWRFQIPKLFLLEHFPVQVAVLSSAQRGGIWSFFFKKNLLRESIPPHSNIYVHSFPWKVFLQLSSSQTLIWFHSLLMIPQISPVFSPPPLISFPTGTG